MKHNVYVVVAAILLAVPSIAPAQFVEDAQRLATPGFGVGARALGMGNAYSGVASDYSALYWNPAGLAQAEYGEFSFGLSYLAPKDASTFFGNQQSYNSNATNLNSLGFVLPVPVQRGSFAIAFGFSREANFTSGLGFSGFNPNSSIIQTWAPDGKAYPPDVTLAEDLQLAQVDTSKGIFISPIKGNVTQSGTVTETGGLNNWMVGGAMDVGPNLSLGLTLTYVSGSYRYDRTYHEQDTKLVYAYPYDFSDLTVTDFIDDNISGFNAMFGMMYREPNRYRIGFTIKTPTSFSIDETFGTKATSTFRTVDQYGENTYGPFDGANGSSKYDVHTPWVFGFSGSVVIKDLVLSGNAEYTDWTQTEFANANQDVLNQNADFATTFRGTFNLRGGAEYEIRPVGIRLRAGYMYFPSIYKGDPTSFDQKVATGGVGFELGGASMLDVGYAYGWRDDYRVNYDASSRVDEHITSSLFLVTFTHRF
ncbi:MAG: outer membrane protein transport protein [Bacteroidota bacterium]